MVMVIVIGGNVLRDLWERREKREEGRALECVDSEYLG